MKNILYFIFFILLSFSFATDSFSQANNWVKKNSFDGTKRERGIALSIGSRGYLGFGHDSGTVVLNDWWEYDPGNDSWTQKANCPGPGRRNPVGFTIGSKAYVGTGDNSNSPSLGYPLFDFWEYDPITNVWTAKAPYPGGFNNGVYSATGFAVNNRGYVCCGKLGPANYTDELWEYNPSNNIWTAKTPYPGGQIYGSSSFVCGNYGYVGLGVDMQLIRNDCWKYDPSVDMWTRVADLPSAPRYAASSFALGPEGFIVCGTDGGYKSELWEYSSTYNVWVQRADFAGGTRIDLVAFSIAGKGFAGTGKSLLGSKRDLWEYTPLAPLGINDIRNKKVTLQLFPNPMATSSVLHIESQVDLKDLTLKIFDVNGKLFETRKIFGNSIEIEREDLAGGIYFISVSDEKEILVTNKLIIQ